MGKARGCHTSELGQSWQQTVIFPGAPPTTELCIRHGIAASEGWSEHPFVVGARPPRAGQLHAHVLIMNPTGSLRGQMPVCRAGSAARSLLSCKPHTVAVGPKLCLCLWLCPCRCLSVSVFGSVSVSVSGSGSGSGSVFAFAFCVCVCGCCCVSVFARASPQCGRRQCCRPRHGAETRIEPGNSPAPLSPRHLTSAALPAAAHPHPPLLIPFMAAHQPSPRALPPGGCRSDRQRAPAWSTTRSDQQRAPCSGCSTRSVSTKPGTLANHTCRGQTPGSLPTTRGGD